MAAVDERAALWTAYWALEALPAPSPAMERTMTEIWLRLEVDDDVPPSRRLTLVGAPEVTS